MEKKIGVYICKGCNIADTVEIEKLSEVAEKKYQRPAWINPIGGLVTATLVVGVATTLWVTNPAPPRQGMEDIELLASVESPEFYQDLDFYLWLEARASAG